MKVLSRKLVEFGGAPAHWCPACQELHRFPVDKERSKSGSIWSWDGNVEKPTFNPSMNINADTATCCHYHLHDGMLIYQADCGHASASTTVPLPDLPDWIKER